MGDQLSQDISALKDLDRANDVVLMVEVHEEATYLRHHKQKIVLVLSAMRHFAQMLRQDGIQADYVKMDEPGNTGSFTGEIRRALNNYQVNRIVLTEPGEWRVWEMMQSWQQTFDVPVEILADDRFICSRAEFTKWSKERRSLRLEYFYRHMRRKTGLLMNGSEPEGGRWNYDYQNRQSLPRNFPVPQSLRFTPDATTRTVIELVRQRYSDHFGDLKPFGWAVTREDAQVALQHFIIHSLPWFGIYQDAMKSGEDFLFHSTLSPYLNLGLLGARQVCEAVLNAYIEGLAPLQAVEGLIRQILGWREFVRGVYWSQMPAYQKTNYFNTDRPLPDFYWTAETKMNCLRQTIEATIHNAYAHHIQRLMITGNFALLTGLSPAEVEAWYLSVYADAFEWVELPNTHGMALHADGGLVGSKPYAASGAYINRMSDYCKGCAYDPKIKLGEDACPFNYLYWHFLIVNKKLLKFNRRMVMPYRTLANMTPESRKQITQQAQEFLSYL